MIRITSDHVGTAALGDPPECSPADEQARRKLGGEGRMASRLAAGRRCYRVFAVLLALVAFAELAHAQSFNAARALQYTREVVAFGPRPIGSANHRKLENYILNHLKGDSVEDDAFTADTIEGKLPVRNLIAKFPGTRDGIIVIAGHYDTNYPLRSTGYVGANDGGSSTAILLELANQLRVKKREGHSVWLLWTDGEEAVKEWTATDSLYGVRHLADKWQQNGTLKNIKAFLLADMIGDADLNVDRDANSTPWLEELVYQAASKLGYQSHFFGRTITVEDDHLPFVQRGVPCADLIDLDYGYGNVFHHTPQDTLDKLSPKSMEIVGAVILETVQLLDQK
ncbi:MAG TPA: M28 family peptidase [Terriglobales bacterium]|nr:M28 family peptidase [Terriglobales bacterium]